MSFHTPIHIFAHSLARNPLCKPLLTFLDNTSSQLTTSSSLDDFHLADVLLLGEPTMLTDTEWQHIERFVHNGGGCVALASGAKRPFPTFFAAQLCEQVCSADVRILFRDPQHPISQRLPDVFYDQGTFQPLELKSDRVEVLLYADWRYEHQPIVTLNQVGEGMAVLTAVHNSQNPIYQQILYRLLRHAAGQTTLQQAVGVGLLGYAPSVGRLHGTGTAQTEGMRLQMACDLSPQRLGVAQQTFPDLALTTDANEMIANPDVDLVIIATPPNSHAALAEQMLAGGKHVICEKPLALTLAQAKRMQAVAEANGRHLSCHQNRRWDNDYRMIKQALEDEVIGEPFYLETFVGGYGHPCGFWHSHDVVSGGTTFDWGAHYLDWMLDLMPGKIESVICTRQNRLWHDITNADRERIQLRYANGAEAEFTHSDLAYIPKPKWYMVGAEGAILGEWRQVETYEVDPVLYYHKHDMPAAEMGAEITVRLRDGRGQLFERTLPEPERISFPFHANLADHLLLGEPIEVPLAHSMRVVAILEAAKRSAEEGGTQVTPEL